MTIANVEMAKAWDGDEGEDWAIDADRYESAGARTWERFLATDPVRPADAVLDIGCGTGHASRELAKRVRSVLGVDLSGRMLEVAREKTASVGLTNVEFIQADAQVHPFEPAAHDVAFSSYGAMFFNDRVAAFTNIGRALQRGGRLHLLVWRPLADNEWLQAIRAALAVGRDLPAPPNGAPGPFGLADPDDTRGALEASGFGDVGFEPIDAPIYFGPDAADAFAFFTRMGITRGLTGGLDDATKATAFDQLQQTLKEHETSDGVLFDSASWHITARRT